MKALSINLFLCLPIGSSGWSGCLFYIVGFEGDLFITLRLGYL